MEPEKTRHRLRIAWATRLFSAILVSFLIILWFIAKPGLSQKLLVSRPVYLTHLLPVDAEVILGASLCVWVVHQRQVSESRDPLGRPILSRRPPQQTHSNVGGVVVLKGDFLNLQTDGGKQTSAPLGIQTAGSSEALR